MQCHKQARSGILAYSLITSWIPPLLQMTSGRLTHVTGESLVLHATNCLVAMPLHILLAFGFKRHRHTLHVGSTTYWPVAEPVHSSLMQGNMFKLASRASTQPPGRKSSQ